MIELTFIEHLQIIFLIINIASNHALAIVMIYKFYKYRVKELLLIGITLLTTAIFHYYVFIISYILILYTGEPINVFYVYITFPIASLWIVVWIIAYSYLTHPSRTKLFSAFIICYLSIFETYYIYILLTRPSNLGELMRGHYMNWAPFISLYLLITMILLVITGIDFSIKAMLSDSQELQLKGKVILLAIIVTFFAVLFESIIQLQGLLFIIPRTLHIFSGILLYIGFVLPKGIKNRLIKDQKE
ncbi:MAG: hypothetical protein EU532_05670 [Promethearchaeota archaeon]|nr:MAG: hypothetical protein EU532_05670 [Candidatus Lokiarchaeota archaeon]